MKAVTLPLLALLCTACTAVEIIPDDLRGDTRDAEASAQSLELWQGSVAMANGFLASPHRQTLPPGEIVLADTGMSFRWSGETNAMLFKGVDRPASGEIPLSVYVADLGGVASASGQAEAQEDGFVVVYRKGPLKDMILENSFFRRPGAREDYLSIEEQADLLLYELAHVFFRYGTASELGKLGFYTEATFAFGNEGKSVDEPPGRTAAEFELYRTGGEPLGPPEPPAPEVDELEAPDPAKQQRYKTETLGG